MENHSINEVIYREKDLNKLLEAYYALESQDLQVRFIVGKTGTGKTVLLDKFLHLVEGKDENVLVTGCACTLAGEDYQPFKDILQEIIREITANQEEKRSRKEKWRQVFGTSADILLKVAPDLIGDFMPMGGLINSIGEKVVEESGIRQRMERMKTGDGILSDVLKLSDQYVEVLQLIARRYRLVIYIDNLHWADRASLELLQRLQVGLRKLPVLLIGCYRGTDMVYGLGDGRHPLEVFVTRVKVSNGDVFIDLDTCDEQERGEGTGRLLELEKVRYGKVFKEKLLKRTGGNPLYVRELLSAMKEKGSLLRGPGGYWYESEQVDWRMCPVRIEGVIREEVAALAPRQARLMAYAAVQGQCFWLNILARMSGEDELELLNCLTDDLGKQRRLIYEGKCFRLGDRVMASFCFSDSFLQEYLYRGLGISKQMMMHGETAEILEELYAGRTREICFELARHYECAGNKTKALDYLEQCIGQAEEAMNYQVAKECAERALVLCGVEKEYWQLRKYSAMRKSGLYPVDRWAGKIAEEKGRKDAEWFWEEWCAHMLAGRLKKGFRLADAFLRTNTDQKGQKYGLLARGIAGFWLGDFKACRPDLEQCAGIAVGDKAELNGAEVFFRVLTEFCCGEYEESEKLYRQWRERIGQGWETEIGMWVSLTGVCLAFMDGDQELMEQGLRQVSGILKRCDTGQYAVWLGVFEAVCEAETAVWRGLDLLEMQENRVQQGVGVTLYGLMGCRLCFNKGLYEEFDRWWERTVERAFAIGEKAYLGELYMLKKRRLEMVGEEEGTMKWQYEIEKWRKDTGGWVMDSL